MSTNENNPSQEITIFRFIAGLNGEPPAPLALGGNHPDLPPEAFEAQRATEAQDWIAAFEKIPDENRPDRLRCLVPELHAFGLQVASQLSKNLRGGVSLMLMIKYGLYELLVDANGRPLFTSQKAFISAYLNAYNISDARDQVSRLLATAKLWLAIVQAGLPFPPVLSRLERLVTLPSLEVALHVYSSLVEAAGGKAPTLAEIEAEVDRWQKPPKNRPDNRDWIKTALRESMSAQVLLMSKEPDLHHAREIISKVTEILKARVPAEKGGKKPAKPPPNSLMPSQPCPLALTIKGNHLQIEVSNPAPAVTKLLEATAPSLFWAKQSDQSWELLLPKGASAVHAKIFQMREWLTRTLEHLDFQAPSLPANLPGR